MRTADPRILGNVDGRSGGSATFRKSVGDARSSAPRDPSFERSHAPWIHLEPRLDPPLLIAPRIIRQRRSNGLIRPGRISRLTDERSARLLGSASSGITSGSRSISHEDSRTLALALARGLKIARCRCLTKPVSFGSANLGVYTKVVCESAQRARPRESVW